ncbi:hypothetical protein FRC12_021560 [Ceratobasidium sp. 428]|nr:hypothetical protein FRC12_021560 [Ceratobasidium sp. 428]
MRDAWRRNKDGRGEEARVRKNQISRCALRENTKAEHRGKALDDFELDHPDDKALCIVQEPAYCTEKVIDLLAAFDVGFKAAKKKTGNQQLTKFKFQFIIVPVPKLKKTSLKYPEWGIDSVWAKENRKEERTSRPYIDNRARVIPPSKQARPPQLHRPQPGGSEADSSFPTWFCSSSTSPRSRPDPVLAPVPTPAPNQVPIPAPIPAPLAAVAPIAEFEPKPEPKPEPTGGISTIPAIFIAFAALIVLAVAIPSIPSVPSANVGLSA